MTSLTKVFSLLVAVVVTGTAIGWLMFDAMPQANTPAPSIVNHNEEAADFYRTCLDAPEDTSGDHFWVFQRAFCQCNTEIAVEQMERSDIRIVLARKSGGDETADKALSKLSDGELAAYVKRLYAFQGKAIPHCMEVGTAAREAARNTM